MMNVSRRHIIAGLGAAAAAAALASSRTARADTADPPTYRPATELVQALAARQISARELLDAAIARIEALDPKIKRSSCAISNGRAQPRHDADAALARGERRRCSACR